jgi:small GTP-binding protein
MIEGEPKRVKILILGNVGSGKTNLLLRYFKNTFDEHTEPTNGSYLANRKFNYKKSQLDVEVLEIGGGSMHSLIPQTFHGTSGLVFVYDCSSKESFTGLQEWIQKAEQFLDVKGLVGVVAATKCDLEKDISEEDGKKFAKLNKLVSKGRYCRLISVQAPRQAVG